MPGKDSHGDDITKAGSHCPEDCLIGLDECAECGACDHCGDGAALDENDLPSHWPRFIEKSGKNL